VGIVLSLDEVVFHSVAYISEHRGFKDRFHFFFIVELAAEPKVVPEEGIEYVKWVNPEEIGELSGGRKTYVELQSMLLADTTAAYFEV
ncbi:hypothetical protein HY312_04180, partial [Candidatus Saccharibacteria bacterium]|nr:hypothetical protein [Candidatus Saccharibacteria bacterium]